MATRNFSGNQLCALCTPSERTLSAQSWHGLPQTGDEMDGAAGVINAFALSVVFWSVVLLCWVA